MFYLVKGKQVLIAQKSCMGAIKGLCAIITHFPEETLLLMCIDRAGLDGVTDIVLDQLSAADLRC